MDKNNFHQYELSEVIMDALTSLGYIEPTKVQNQVIPFVLDRKDIIVKSQTGSGKTAAYGIPVCERIDWMENKPQALILVPTRELAIQVKEDITNIGRIKRVKAAVVYGRQPIGIQISDLKQKTHVVVGTPGRVMDHLERGTLNISRIKYLVIDEADEMLNMGFIEQVNGIIKMLPKERVTMLFSATMPDKVKELALNYMKDPVNIEINSESICTDNINHFIYKVEEEDKFSLLRDVTLVENPDSCILFCRTKERVDMLYDRLHGLQYSCDKIHGGLEQKERLKAMNRFKRGEFRYMVATNLAARGIDINDITLVLNYDIPFEKEGYVHRTGRTGRAGQEGRAITFVTSHEVRYLKEIEEYLGMEITVLSSPDKNEVLQGQTAFAAKMNTRPAAKEEKGALLNQQITKLRINSGKKKNLRATTLVGILSNIDGVAPEDIGIITILDTLSYVEILNGKGTLVIKAIKNITIKGKTLKVTIIEK